jgi:hypothetical protein
MAEKLRQKLTRINSDRPSLNLPDKYKRIGGWLLGIPIVTLIVLYIIKPKRILYIDDDSDEPDMKVSYRQLFKYALILTPVTFIILWWTGCIEI